MWFAMFQGEQNMAELIHRLFQIRGPQAEALAREAETALLQANPHLNFANIPQGTLIVVPEVAGAPPAEDAKPVGTAVGEKGREVRRALVDMRVTLKDSATHQAEEANATLQILESRELPAMAERMREIKERLPQIADKAKADLEAASTLNAFQARGWHN
jgi:hypothetical protein